MTEETSDGDKVNITLEGASIEDVLAKGFGGKGLEYEGRVTEVQLPFIRWVLRCNAVILVWRGSRACADVVPAVR
ncbi:uncharacterized protein BJ212DRAFT_1373942 [Suillus subaureus]|uniref:Uncharacterized protein n=1 Tax=Suillus subaureus TaxID=48587 RepID=A0A9P7E694_9AGAM|nr:uncharacterized protein BJ212DRAFT_1373942 [Suillus subaureus]KAG1811901.1 hypothetical protein BJ212DRAFT_1373942 [Suillus subaureus]